MTAARAPDLMASWEPFLPFPAPRGRIPRVTAFRSTWLASSLGAARDRGHFDRYAALLPDEHREAILSSVAGSWTPIDACVAHYRTLERLELSRIEERAMALHEVRGVQATSFGLVMSLAKQAGVTPWTLFKQLQRVWERVWQGGAVAVHKDGPKDAILEAVGWPLAGVPYVRRTMPQVMHAVIEPFCTKAYLVDVPALWTPTSMALRASWV